jgi:hypothetical protein
MNPVTIEYTIKEDDGKDFEFNDNDRMFELGGGEVQIFGRNGLIYDTREQRTKESNSRMKNEGQKKMKSLVDLAKSRDMMMSLTYIPLIKLLDVNKKILIKTRVISLIDPYYILNSSVSIFFYLCSIILILYLLHECNLNHPLSQNTPIEILIISLIIDWILYTIDFGKASAYKYFTIIIIYSLIFYNIIISYLKADLNILICDRFENFIIFNIYSKLFLCCMKTSVWNDNNHTGYSKWLLYMELIITIIWIPLKFIDLLVLISSIVISLQYVHLTLIILLALFLITKILRKLYYKCIYDEQELEYEYNNYFGRLMIIYAIRISSLVSYIGLRHLGICYEHKSYIDSMMLFDNDRISLSTYLSNFDYDGLTWL